MRLNDPRRVKLSKRRMREVLANESEEAIRQYMDDFYHQCTTKSIAPALGIEAREAVKLALDLRTIDRQTALRSRLPEVPFRAQPLPNQVAAQYIRIWNKILRLSKDDGDNDGSWICIPPEVLRASINVLCTGLRPLEFDRVIWAGFQYAQDPTWGEAINERRVAEAAVLHNCFDENFLQQFWKMSRAFPGSFMLDLIGAKERQIWLTGEDRRSGKSRLLEASTKLDPDEIAYLRLRMFVRDMESERNLVKAVFGEQAEP